MTSDRPRHYSSNLLKGGALIPESLRLLEAWRPSEDARSFAERVLAENVLGKATRSRLRDILDKVFARRFLAPTVPSIAAARALLERDADPMVATRVLLYHAALADDLLHDFITDELYALHEAGRSRVDVADALAFINRLTTQGLIAPPWAEYSRLRMAQGLLATVRDFGLLAGAVHKHFAPHFLPFEAFVYVAYHLRDRGVGAARFRGHPTWRLFLLPPEEVEQLLLEAHQRGFLRYHAAGGIVRIDWSYPTLESAVDGLVARSPVGA